MLGTVLGALVHTLFPLVLSTSYEAAATGPGPRKGARRVKELADPRMQQVLKPSAGLTTSHPISTALLCSPQSNPEAPGGRGTIPHTKGKCNDEERGGDRRSQVSLSLPRP